MQRWIIAWSKKGTHRVVDEHTLGARGHALSPFQVDSLRLSPPRTTISTSNLAATSLQSGWHTKTMQSIRPLLRMALMEYSATILPFRFTNCFGTFARAFPGAGSQDDASRNSHLTPNLIHKARLCDWLSEHTTETASLL